MGRTKRRSSSHGASADQIPALERSTNDPENPAADLENSHPLADRIAKGNESLKQEYEQELQFLRLERAELHYELENLRQRLSAVELERDTGTRLVQQQTYQISRMHRELAECGTQAQLIQKLLHSVSWRITAPLRTAKLMLARIMPSRR